MPVTKIFADLETSNVILIKDNNKIYDIMIDVMNTFSIQTCYYMYISQTLHSNCREKKDDFS